MMLQRIVEKFVLEVVWKIFPENLFQNEVFEQKNIPFLGIIWETVKPEIFRLFPIITKNVAHKRWWFSNAGHKLWKNYSKIFHKIISEIFYESGL